MRVSQAEKITGKNLTLPVLSSVLLIAQERNLKIRSTNLSLGLEIDIPTKVEKEGVVAVSGSVLSNILNNVFQNENISLDGSDGNLTIKTKKSLIKIKGQSHEDFPTIPRVVGETFNIEAKKLLEGIKAVYYSSSVSDIKPEISSVFIYSEGENLVFVATDSFRLAEKKIKVKGIPDIQGILIPYKNITEILKIFNDSNSTITVIFNKNQISFSADDIYLTSRIIDGVFPDYRQIIPKKNTTSATVLKQDLLNALKLSNIFSDKFNQVNLEIKTIEKLFQLSSMNHEIGENRTGLDAALTGEDVIVSFNYKYFLDCFTSITNDSVSIKISSSTEPMMISGVSDTSFMYLIMPMNR